MSTTPATDPSTLPARWQDCFAPMTLAVPCGGGTHRVTWTPDGVVTEDHDPEAETAFVALGGEPSRCASVAELWGGTTIDDLQRWGEGIWSPEQQWWGAGHSLADIVPPGQERAFVVRGGKRAATRYLCEEALLEWLGGLGVPTEGAEVRIQVGPGEHPFRGDESVPRAGLHATWAPDAPLRALVMVSDTWYDEVREHGAVRDGRLWLGNNGTSGVVGEIRVEHVNAGVRASGSSHLLPHLLALGVPERASREPLGVEAVLAVMGEAAGGQLPEAPEGCLYVGGYAVYDYDDNNYWLTPGMEPTRVFTSPRDALLWAVQADVQQTYAPSSPLFYEYVEAGQVQGWPVPVDFSEDDISAGELLAKVVEAEVSLSRCSIGFATVSAVRGPRG